MVTTTNQPTPSKKYVSLKTEPPYQFLEDVLNRIYGEIVETGQNWYVNDTEVFELDDCVVLATLREDESKAENEKGRYYFDFSFTLGKPTQMLDVKSGLLDAINAKLKKVLGETAIDEGEW